MYDVIIIGAGTAGLTAAIYTGRALKKTLVLEGMAYGGQIINASNIENYPAAKNISGFDFANNLYEQAKELGAEIKFETVTEVKDKGSYKTVSTADDSYKAKAVIIASGANSRKLELEGEEKLTGRGISYCATCDGAFFRDKTVAVVGGGNTALEDALYLAELAKKVYIIHRYDKFEGDAATAEKLKEHNNIEYLMESNIVKLHHNETLTGVEIKNNQNKTQTLELDGLFLAIGQVPNTAIFKDLVDLDEYGYIVAKEDCKTKIPGIFAAGDIRTKKLRQLVTAASDGAVAATAAIEYTSS